MMAASMAQTATERPPAARRTPPGPGRRGSLRLIGERRRDPLGTFVRLRDAHGPVVSFRMGPLDMYLVTEPDLVQEVFTTHSARVRKGRILQGARVILGDGLLTAEGEHHRRQRRLIQPAFHRERLDGYARIMSRRAAEAADGWADGQVIDVFSEMSALTMGVVGESLFGTGLGEEFDRVEEALVDVFRAFDLLVLPFAGLRMRMPTRTVRRFAAAKADLDRIVDGIIAERRAEGRDRGDLLSMLLDAQDADDGAAMTDEEVRHEVMTLFAAGLETTANALTFTWYLLARHPEVDERLREEARELATGLPGLDDLARLPFAQMVLQESMRLYPPAWMIARRCVEDLPLGDYTIPAGGLVMMPPYLLHRDPRFWPDPERFDPGRWAEDGGAPPHRYSYLPFGAGTRKCIGATFASVEGALLLAVIARRARLEAVSDRSLELLPQITLRPRGAVPMRVSRPG
jgi:cytochrome P450